MKEGISRTALLNNAGIAGIAFGAISSAYLFLNQFMSGMDSPILVTILTFILWAAKFVGCIFLMKFFMERFVDKHGIKDNSVTMRFGIATAFCSALIYAAVTLANVLIISPDLIHEQMDMAIQAYGSMLDSNAISMLEKIEEIMPQMTFFSNLTYCALYGTILSAILSRNIPSRDPFAGYEQNKTEE
ncbi:MAG: DUF4199 domain-containing protein [Bacteroidales bacterium]|nr:DUF4199 domain-containing protein [Bacteroidales bacterium]